MDCFSPTFSKVFCSRIKKSPENVKILTFYSFDKNIIPEFTSVLSGIKMGDFVKHSMLQKKQHQENNGIELKLL